MGKTGKREFAVINKADLPQRIEIEKLKTWLPETPVLRVSALKQEGFTELIKQLEDVVISGGIPEAGEIVLTKLRHRDCLERTRDGIGRAEASLKKGMSQEFIVVDIREAMEALGEVTGQTVTDDILNRIFSEFCIGK